MEMILNPFGAYIKSGKLEFVIFQTANGTKIVHFFRSETAGDLFVIFLLYEPWVVSLNPEDVKVHVELPYSD